VSVKKDDILFVLYYVTHTVESGTFDV